MRCGLSVLLLFVGCSGQVAAPDASGVRDAAPADGGGDVSDLGPSLDGAGPGDTSTDASEAGDSGPVPPADAAAADAGAEVDAGEPPPPEPPAVDHAGQRIEDELAAGAIDAKTAALFHVIAMVDPTRLPSRLQTQDPIGLASSAHLVAAASFLPAYSADERAAVNSALLPPSHSDFLRFPESFRSAPAFAAGGPQYCTQRFLSPLPAQQGNYAHVGDPVDTAYFRFYPFIPGNTAAANVAAELTLLRERILRGIGAPITNVGAVGSHGSYGAYLDAVHDHYVSIGMRAPRSNPAGLWTIVDHGGGEKIPVYLTDCDATDRAAPLAYASPFGQIVASVGLALEEPELRKIVLPHELFHVFEHAIMEPRGSSIPAHDAWPYEAAATAMEHEVSTEVRRWSGRLRSGFTARWLTPMSRAFQCPEEPFHSAFTGKCRREFRAHGNSNRNLGDYSKFVYFLWKTKKAGGPSYMRGFWDRYLADGGDPKKGLVPVPERAEFQRALLTEPPSGPREFEPDDRAEFTRSLDLPVGDLRRYTHRVDPAVLGASVFARAVPDDPISTDPEWPRFTTRPSLPMAPGSTHRWYLETARTAIAEPISGVPSYVVADHTPPGDRLELEAIALDGPTRVRTPSDPVLDTATLAKTEFQVLMPGTSPHEHLLVLLTSAEEEAGGLAFHYSASVQITPLCVDRCVERSAPLVNPCCDALPVEARGACRSYARVATYGTCAYTCLGLHEPPGEGPVGLAPELPYPPWPGEGSDVGGLLTSAGGVERATPFGRVPIRTPPQFTCAQFGVVP